MRVPRGESTLLQIAPRKPNVAADSTTRGGTTNRRKQQRSLSPPAPMKLRMPVPLSWSWKRVTVNRNYDLRPCAIRPGEEQACVPTRH